uniref:Uncharacterized protein n=1 Tax=Triticum urartu TaxID=4572 RepID=A0A8R7U779_TRIUA
MKPPIKKLLCNQDMRGKNDIVKMHAITRIMLHKNTVVFSNMNDIEEMHLLATLLPLYVKLVTFLLKL